MRILLISDCDIKKGRGKPNLSKESSLEGVNVFSLDEFINKIFLKLKNEGQDVAELLNPILDGIYPIRKLFNIKVFKQTIKKINSFNPDVIYIHSFHSSSSTTPFIAAKIKKIPVVLTVHDAFLACPIRWSVDNKGKICERNFGIQCVTKLCGPNKMQDRNLIIRYLDQIWSFFKGFIYRRTTKKTVDMFVFPSSALAEKTSKSLKIPEKKARVIHNFTNIEESLNKPFVEKRNSQFLFVGRISPEKGLDVLIDSLSILVNERMLKDIHLKIVGDGTYANHIKDKVDKLKLKENVTFTGWINDEKIKNKLYGESIASIVPSVWFEAFGLIVIEAFKNKTCVIASDVGGLHELISDKKTGLLFKRADPIDLANKMETIYKNPDFAIKLGKAAYNELKDKYTANNYYKELMSAFNDVILKKKEK